MYIKIPDEIEIYGVTYTIKWVDELEGNRVAQIHFMDSEIQISNDMSDEISFLSFVHEITHGILQGQNLFLGERIYHDEDFVERTSQGIAQVLKQIVEYNLIMEEFDNEEPPMEDDIEMLKLSLGGITD